jgi:hypothetical protein
VLENGKVVVGRIFHLDTVAPECRGVGERARRADQARGSRLTLLGVSPRPCRTPSSASVRLRRWLRYPIGSRIASRPSPRKRDRLFPEARPAQTVARCTSVTAMACSVCSRFMLVTVQFER